MVLIKKYLSKEQIISIVKKCRDSDDFKQKFMTHPYEIVKEVTGIDLTLPEGIQLVVNDQSVSKVAYFTIPAVIQFDDVELNESQLDMISGGTGGLKG